MFRWLGNLLIKISELFTETQEKQKELLSAPTHLNWCKCKYSTPNNSNTIILFDDYRYLCGKYDMDSDKYVIYELNKEIECNTNRFIKWAYL